MKLARVKPVEPEDASDKFYVERRRGEIEHVPGAFVIRKSRFFLVLVLVAALVGGGFYYVIHSHSVSSKTVASVTATQGKLVLSGDELRQVVIREGITAYWVGPEPGADYALSVLADGRVYVRYLPKGKGLTDKEPAYKVIATYVTANAFVKTQQAATSEGSVGFVNGDGNAVYYAKARPTNVYIGLKSADLQVEVFDPVAGRALSAAESSGMVRKIV